MGIEHAKSIQEMNMMNKRFYNRVNSTQKVILARLAYINLNASKRLAEERRFTGLLVSLIDLESAMGGLKFRVISSAPHSYEIEEGLEQPEFRTYADYPKLKAWAEAKLGFVPKMGLTVHTKGSHFMKSGLDIAYEMSNDVISQELGNI